MIEFLVVESADRPEFVVDTAVNQVAITSGLYPLLADFNGYTHFAAGDNIRIQSLGYLLPYDFAPGDGLGVVAFYWVPESDPVHPIYITGSYIPIGNQEIEVDMFFTSPGERAQLAMLLTAVTVSMENVAAQSPALSGTFHVMPFAKILHNQALTA